MKSHRWRPRRDAGAWDRPTARLTPAATPSEHWRPVPPRASRTRPERRSPIGKGSGRGDVPRSCSTVNTAGSSTSASGLPPVAATMWLATISSTRAPALAVSSSWASWVDRPASVIRRIPSKRRGASGVSRVVRTDATRSLWRRRPTNDNAIADSSSTHCASSMTTSTGCERAASSARLKTERPTRNGSSASCSVLPSTASSVARCGSGRASTQSRRWRASWCTAAYPNVISDSTPTMRTTRKSDATSTRVVDQRRFADARRAGEQDGGGDATLGVTENLIDDGPFDGAADEEVARMHRLRGIVHARHDTVTSAQLVRSQSSLRRVASTATIDHEGCESAMA